MCKRRYTDEFIDDVRRGIFTAEMVDSESTCHGYSHRGCDDFIWCSCCKLLPNKDRTAKIIAKIEKILAKSKKSTVDECGIDIK